MADFLSRITSLFGRRRRRGLNADLPVSILGYRFKDTDLLREALTHRSYANSVSTTRPTNDSSFSATRCWA